MSGTSSKSATSSMPSLIEIDELTRPDHWHLRAEDDCFFLGEYFAKQGWKGGRTNQLIFNLKKSLDRRGTPEWVYKGRAIRQAAHELRAALHPDALKDSTIVPMPPSKAPTDPLYDDRMAQVVRTLCEGTKATAAELLYQKESRKALHQSEARRDVAALIEHFAVNEALAKPAPDFVIVVDDVLTTGAHFRAAKTVLQTRFGAALTVVGVFIARRIPQTEEPDDDD